jgi:hypothetical protein
MDALLGRPTQPVRRSEGSPGRPLQLTMPMIIRREDDDDVYDNYDDDNDDCDDTRTGVSRSTLAHSSQVT